MESKKDIGNYFKKNLEQLDYSPSNKVWDGIEVELKEKKKIRRFIFWLFFAVAIIGIVSTYNYYSIYTSGKSTTNSVVTTDSINSNENTNKSSDANSKTENKNIEIGLANDEENKIENSNLKNTTNSYIKSNATSTENSSIKSKSNNTIRIVSKDTNLKNNLSNKSKYKKVRKINEADSFLLVENKTRKHSEKSKKPSKSNASNPSIALEEQNISVDTLSSNLDALKDAVTKTALTSTEDKKINLDELKKANQKKRDSLIAIKKAEKDKKGLAEKPKEDKEKDSTKLEVAKSRGIIIAPYYGYNYNGNFGNGNFLNDSKTSKKSSLFKASYGVLVRWMGSDKIGAQIGVGIINATYSATFEKTNNNFIGPNSVSFDIPLNEINDLFPNPTKVSATHETTYIEVPIEGYYIFSNKKFGYATSFGISLLKLQNDELFLESDTVDRIKIGELKSTSPFCFSANMKLNLFYKISPKLQFDLYPSFQYQFMGYKDVSNYHPYFFSIKTGLSYKL